jgi:hypothetical protein
VLGMIHFNANTIIRRHCLLPEHLTTVLIGATTPV